MGIRVIAGTARGKQLKMVPGDSTRPIMDRVKEARDSQDAAVFRGGLVYSNYCVTCHGINADGNGRAARLHTPRPANLRASDKNDEYIRLIVAKGGEAIGRSPKMPPWGEELTDEQIGDVVAFVRSVIVATQPAPQTVSRLQ